MTAKRPVPRIFVGVRFEPEEKAQIDATRRAGESVQDFVATAAVKEANARTKQQTEEKHL